MSDSQVEIAVSSAEERTLINRYTQGRTIINLGGGMCVF